MSETRNAVAWRAAEIQLHRFVPTDERVPVSGFVADAVPGLAVTRVHRVDGTNDPARWQVTHLATGDRVITDPFRSREAAQRAAERAAPLTDWTQPKSAFSSMAYDADLRVTLRRIAEEEGAIHVL